MPPLPIDLNADLGEDPALIAAGVDRALLAVVTSANIACGGHAGDDVSMRRTIDDALALGVAIGAHPAYPDRPRFGRVELALPPDEIEREVHDQIAALASIAHSRGAVVRHVKPHGALYHAAMHKPGVARAVANAAHRVSPTLILVGQAGSPALDQWRALGLRIAAEAFADRLYEPDGTLRARTNPSALIDDPAQAAEQARRIARGEGVLASDGTVLPIRADTICIHADTPDAPIIARAVRDTLERASITVRPPIEH